MPHKVISIEESNRDPFSGFWGFLFLLGLIVVKIGLFPFGDDDNGTCD